MKMYPPPELHHRTRVREFRWSDPELEDKLLAVNFPPYQLPRLLAHRDRNFTIELPARSGAPAERWEFRPGELCGYEWDDEAASNTCRLEKGHSGDHVAGTNTRTENWDDEP